MRASGLVLRRALPIMWVCIFAASGCKLDRTDVLRVGVTPGPAEEILHAIEPDLAKHSLVLKIVRFSDSIQPDLALASHDLDVNLYQNAAFLNQFNRDHQTHLVSLGGVYLPIMAIYPGRAKSLDALADGARIAIPNDPVSHDRALLLLGKAGLLQLAHDAGSTSMQILANPKQLKLVEVDAAQLSRSLDDADIAVIDASAALDAKLNPQTGSLLSEARDSPYANVLSANAEALSDPRVRILTAALASPGARNFISTRYGGAIYPVQ